MENMNEKKNNPFSQGFFTLVITEKPSVAKQFAGVLGAYTRKDGWYEGNGYLISWCLGHLSELAAPEVYDPKYKQWNISDLPILPKPFLMVTDGDKAEHAAMLYEQMNRPDVKLIVNACDAGREGELIFRNAYALSKSTIPVKRLWLSSMEEDAIQDGFAHLKPSEEFDNLGIAARCRAEADWLVGINGSRAFTSAYGERMSVGRVQTPTLSMLAKREKDIAGHKVKESWSVKIDTGCGLILETKPSDDRTACSQLSARCENKTVTITDIRKRDTRNDPPLLYDLTTLQREANRYYGFPAQATLDLLQKLYLDKLITYPRSDSRYVTHDMEFSIYRLIKEIPNFDGFQSMTSPGNVSRVIDDQKVSDHTAILPTKQLTPAVFRERSAEEQHLLRLLLLRVLESTSQEALLQEKEVTGVCCGEEFTAHGKIYEQMGYLAARQQFLDRFLPDYSREQQEERISPERFRSVKTGDKYPVEEVSVESHRSSPPKHYTEDTLLRAMQNAESKSFLPDVERTGLGTPATRAGIIEKLIRAGYVQRNKKHLLCTEDGASLISRMPETLCSAALTADWENHLRDVEAGTLASSEFMAEIQKLTGEIVEEARKVPPPKKPKGLSVGCCPLCGEPVMEGEKLFYCVRRDCRFALWKENRFLTAVGKELSREMAADLLKDGATHVTDFRSRKKNRSFIADLHMNVEEDGKIRYSLSFPNESD